MKKSTTNAEMGISTRQNQNKGLLNHGWWLLDRKEHPQFCAEPADDIAGIILRQELGYEPHEERRGKSIKVKRRDERTLEKEL
jgi:hypothetical protein